MNKSPAFQFYVNDFLGSAKVGMMNGAEIGVYFMLLLLDWQEGGFEYEPTLLARWCRVDEPTLEKAWVIVSKCFGIAGGRYFNPRLQEERSKQEAWRLKCSEGGIASGKARLKGSSTTLEQHLNTPSPTPSPSPTPNNNKQQQQLSSASPTIPATALVIRKDPATTALQARTAQRKTVQQALDLAAEVVFRYWRDSMGFDPNRTILNDKRRARLIARLRENGGDVSELLHAVDGALRDDWTMGRDPRSTKLYNGTETIFRDREKVEALLVLAPNRDTEHPYLQATP